VAILKKKAGEYFFESLLIGKRYIAAIFTIGKRLIQRIDPGISMRFQPRYTKVISDFDKIFSVCRAFNSKQFDKKKIRKAFVLTEINLKYFKQ
jgi:hypothetical protein